MPKRDDIDLKILEKLDENIRIGNKEIGKALGLRRQVVDYRIKKMESNGTIIAYRTLANLSKLGFPYRRVHIKLDSVTRKEKDELFHHLVNHKKTVWVNECDGKYDLMVGIVAYSFSEFQQTFFKIVEKFSDQILYYDIVTVMELIVPGRDFSGAREPRKIKGAITGNFEKEKISEIDKKIINELAANGRQTVLAIAKKIDESPEKTNYHLKQIMKKHLIFSNIQFGYEFFGFELYKTLLYVKKPSRKRIDELKSFVRTYPRIWDISETIGKWQLELDIESRGHKDYYEIMDTVQDKFSDVISHYDTLYIRREWKFLFNVF